MKLFLILFLLIVQNITKTQWECQRRFERIIDVVILLKRAEYVENDKDKYQELNYELKNLIEFNGECKFNLERQFGKPFKNFLDKEYGLNADQITYFEHYAHLKTHEEHAIERWKINEKMEEIINKTQVPVNLDLSNIEDKEERMKCRDCVQFFTAYINSLKKIIFSTHNNDDNDDNVSATTRRDLKLIVQWAEQQNCNEKLKKINFANQIEKTNGSKFFHTIIKTMEHFKKILNYPSFPF